MKRPEMNSDGFSCDVLIASAFKKAKSMKVISDNSSYNWHVKDLIRHIQLNEGFQTCFLSNSTCSNDKCYWRGLCNCNSKQTPIES